jgi:hypothetical protein
MDIGICISRQVPILFSAILDIFHVGSSILTIAASYYNPCTENSHVVELFAQVGPKPWSYQSLSPE